MTQPVIEIPRESIAQFCLKWKIRELALFGSVLSANFGPESDVDVLITFTENAHWSLYDWIDMREELKTIFGREVDLASSRALRNPYRRHEILNSREIIYAA